MREDKVIALLRGNGKGKRAPKNTELHVVELDPGKWAVQHNGRILEEGLFKDVAQQVANERCKRMQALTGKPHSVVVL